MAHPRIIVVQASRIDEDAEIAALVRETRAEADGFIFLSGGASNMTAQYQRAIAGLFDAIVMLAGDSLRFAVGDGGTQAGIMQAAGDARKRSPRPFALIGVTPAREIPPIGTTAVDPNHSVIVAVDDSAWNGADGYFGSETTAMYQLFGRLAEGRPSVAVVANGGGITLTEVRENIRANRRVILIAGSGGAADAIVSLLDGAVAGDSALEALCKKAAGLGLTSRPDLFHVFRLQDGAGAFAEVLRAVLR